MICSQYKLTFFGVVLLDFDELVDRQPELPVTGDAQVVSFAGAVTGAVFGRGNTRQAVSWSRLKQYGSHAEAYGWAVAMREKVPTGKAGTLTIEVQDGATFELADFVLNEARVVPFEYPGFKAQETYSGQGAGLTVTDRGGLGGGEMGTDTRLMGDATVLATMAEDEI